MGTREPSGFTLSWMPHLGALMALASNFFTSHLWKPWGMFPQVGKTCCLLDRGVPAGVLEPISWAPNLSFGSPVHCGMCVERAPEKMKIAFLVVDAFIVLNNVPPQIRVGPEPQKVTLFGNRILADVIS